MNTDEVIKTQRAWLDKICAANSQFQATVLIKCIIGEMPENAKEPRLYYWIPYKDVMHLAAAPIYTRGVFKNEVFFDPDIKNWDTLRREMGKVTAFSKKEGIPLMLGYSGGNGIHGNVFFNSFLIDDTNFDDCKTYDIDLFRIVRNVLLDIILMGAGTTRGVLSIDPKKVSFSKDRMGSQVREYGTTREDGQFKTFLPNMIIPETREDAQQLPLRFPESVELWNVPEKYNKQINQAIRKAIEKAKKANEYSTEVIDLRGNKISAFPCMNHLFKYGAQSGNRYYGAGAIALMAKRCGLNWKVTEDIIKKYFTKCLATPLEEQERIENCKPLFEGTDYQFSCQTMKEVFGNDVCQFKSCILCEKISNLEKEKEEAEKEKETEIQPYIIAKAKEMLDEGSPIPYLIKTFHTIHIGDDITGKATLAAIGSQSVRNSDGIQPKVSGASGKGKSHAEKTIIHLTPREYVVESSLSDMVAYHAELKPGMIIFSDDVNISEGLQGIIKRSTTNFQTDTIHTISVKKNGGEWGALKLTIPPRIIWLLTSVEDTGSIEFLNRQFNLGVDESEKVDDEVMGHQLEAAVNGTMSFPITDDVLICREIIRDIKEKWFVVTIPFAKRIQWNNPSNRRNLPQFLDIIKSFAVFDYRHRIHVNENTIEATEEDFDMALSLYSSRAINQRFKLNDNELKVLKLMEKDKPYDIKTIQKITGLSYASVYRLFHGRDKGTGLLDKVPDLVYEPETKFLGESEISGENEYEHEYTITKVTKPMHVYILGGDFRDLSGYSSVAYLKKEGKKI